VGVSDRGRWVEVGGVPVHLVEPVGAARGAVVVGQEAFGVTGHIRAVAGRLADRGYVAATPALYHRTGAPQLGYEAGLDQMAPHLAALSPDGVLADVDAATSLLGDLGFAPSQVGLVGFCLGGWVSFLVAARRPLGASVGYYGTIVHASVETLPALVAEAPSLQTPWCGHFGEADAFIPVDDVTTLDAALAAAPVDHDVHRYPGARHGFSCDERPSYDPGAAASAWQRTLAWLDDHLAPAVPTPASPPVGGAR
jgi:carboxymethylenebutenolidase